MHLQIFNACKHFCLMKIIVGSKMSKTEYDLKAMVYPAYDTPLKLCNIRGELNIQQPRMPPNIAGRPLRQFKWLLNWLKWRAGSPPVHFLFSRWGEASVRGAQTLMQGSRFVLSGWGNTPTRHTSTENYTNESIHARYQSSVGYLAW